jgi:hypothetical protein
MLRILHRTQCAQGYGLGLDAAAVAGLREDGIV